MKSAKAMEPAKIFDMPGPGPGLRQFIKEVGDGVGFSDLTSNLLSLSGTFLSSCVALLASSALFEGSVDNRLSAVSDLFEAWCKENHCRPQLRRFTKAKLAWLSSADFPQGT